MKEIQSPKQHEVGRPPIVVVLGHVDHGKSSLLEAIREDFKITSKESGGITQHIGAYQVEVPGEPKSAEASSGGGLQKKITFIDTPGHEAFSAMRSRGAKIADIAVLVVAADSGVQEQTKEAIKVIQGSGIPMIVALNKIDKPGADPEKVKRELSENTVFVESFGGSVPCLNTSATTKQGILELLEMILLVADIAHLTSDPGKRAQGAVIETSLDSRRGNSATLLIKDGTLRIGDTVGTPSAWGKAKILQNFEGESVQEASPSTPVVIVGFEEPPHIGEEFQVFENEGSARAFLSPARIATQSVAGGPPQGGNALNLVLKADVAGSLEALQGMLSVLPQEKIALRIVDSKVGDIGEGDVRLAQGTNARVLGFLTKVNAQALDLAQRENIPLETFDTVYDLIQHVRALMEKNQESQFVRKDIGNLRVLAVFLREKDRQIIGGRVLEGEVHKGISVEVMRNHTVVGQGRLLNLQKNKKDADLALKGDECGLLFTGDIQVEVGDVLQFHILAPDTI